MSHAKSTVDVKAKLESAKKLLADKFQFSDYREGQLEILTAIFEQKDCLAIMPTGGGKSLTYQLPAFTEGFVLVISPLVSLMYDQVQKAKAVGLRAEFINSSLNKEEREKRHELLKKSQIQILFVTPERFRKPDFVEIIKQQKVALFVVDEAHCISLWGHDFRPDYVKLNEIKKLLGSPATIALTATATLETQKDIIQKLDLKDPKRVITSIRRNNLHLNVIEVYGIDEKVAKIIEIHKNIKGPKIIYTTLIKTIYDLSKELQKNKIDHLMYHGDLSHQDKQKKQKAFMAGDDVLMIATPAFGLGIDKSNVRSIIHTEIPSSIEAYFQEVGRAGRDGLRSDCYLLYDEDDVSIQMEFIKWANPDKTFIEQIIKIIEQNELKAYSEGASFIKEQMIYKSKHDYRVESALKQLEKIGVLQESPNPLGYILVNSDEGIVATAAATANATVAVKNFDQKQIDQRTRVQNEKLLQMLRYSKQDDCRMLTIEKYFGLLDAKECGHCDRCLS